MAAFSFLSRNKNKDTQEKKEEKSQNGADFLWAVAVAVLVRWLLFEAYTIPTSSMEKSLLVGDYLFVSKLHYGSRTPKTPLQIPLTHQTIWLTSIPSYTDLIQIPMFRFPGFSHVKNNDVVVFNWPVDFQYPTDLKTNYIKRCIGIGGDTIELRRSVVYINGKAAQVPAEKQSSYLFLTDQVIQPRTFWNNNITDFTPLSHTNGYMVQTSEQVAKQFADFSFIKQVIRQEDAPGEAAPYIFPNNSIVPWNVDNFGPLWIPKEDATIELNPKNVILYGKTIIDYENLKNAEIRDSLFYIDGVLAKSHTFRQNYYFMMGDNRHNSQDSRFWGFVPEDHIVGKAWLVWLSIDPNNSWFSSIRWNRIFKFIE